jgi:O-antigen ligase
VAVSAFDSGRVRRSSAILFLSLSSILAPGFFIGSRRNTIEDLSQSPVNISNLLSTGLVGLAGLIGLVWVVSNLRHVRGVLRSPLGWYSVYAFLAVGSVAYSGYAFLTLARALVLLAGVVALLALAGQALHDGPDDLRLLRSISVSLWVFVGLVWLASFITPADATLRMGISEARLTGGSLFYWSANVVGDIGGLCALSAIAGIYPQRKAGLAVRALAVALAVATVLSTMTRSALAALILALAYVVWQRRIRWTLFAGVLAVVPAVVWAWERVYAFVLRGQTVDQFLMATGRVPYWLFVLESLQSRWLLGWGFYVGGRLAVSGEWRALTGQERSNLDNTFLEVAANGGLVGLLPFLLFSGGLLVLSLRVGWRLRGVKTPAGDAVLFAGSAVTFLMARAVFGPTFHDWGFPLLVLGLASAVLWGAHKLPRVSAPIPG